MLIVRATCMERAGGVAVRRSILDRVGVKRGREMLRSAVLT